MVDDLLQTALGKPPKQFRYKGQRYTPRTFSKNFLGLRDRDLDYVTLTHYPNRAWNRGYCTTATPGMQPFTEYNVSKSVIQQAVKKTLSDGEAVLFGINAGDDHPHRATGKHLPDKAKGILSKAAFKYKNLIPSPSLSKRDKLKAGLSGADHAMAITGYNPGMKRGSVQKWKVENSHGTDTGDKGYFHMYDDYFRRHVEDVVVPRSSVPKSVLKQLESRPVLKPALRKTSP
jgi:bleomycin hydrolase